MEIKILHLSDLHIKSENLSQDIVLSSLAKTIESIFENERKPNVLIVTGDIAFSGKAEEYEKAKAFIDRVVSACSIQQNNIFFIPGNHDVDRKKIEDGQLDWWYHFKDENALNKILNSDISFPVIKAKNDAYFEFVSKYHGGQLSLGKYGQYVHELNIAGCATKIKIVGLNSSIFCGYDGDDQSKLAVGLEQITYCDDKVNPKKEIVISCIHHPFNCFHNCESVSLEVLQRFSDIILSGHVHVEKNSFRRDGNSGETLFVTAGAAYEYRQHRNSFNTIEIDCQKVKGQIKFYKYLPHEHLWILNKDINYATNGVFDFVFAKGLAGDEIITNGQLASGASVNGK